MTLDDYLWRRTSIAQWTPRMGLGRNGEGRDELLMLARELAGGDDAAAEKMLRGYENRVCMTHDPLLDI